MAVDLSVALANLKFQGVDLLTNNGKSSAAGTVDDTGASFMDLMNAVGGTSTAQSSDTSGLLDVLMGNSTSALGTGSVFDQILGDGSNLLSAAFNYRQTGYSNELSRLEAMRDKISGLSSTAKSLQSITSSTDTEDIKTALQNFVQQYNAWDAEFDGDVAAGGVLAGSQAANMARFSMQRDVTDVFNGHGNGGIGNGMSELGIEVGADGQITFDTAKFDQAMATNKTAAVTTITNMAYVTARDADSLDAQGNVLSNRIGRLEDALSFIAQSKSTMQAQDSAQQQAAAMSMYSSMMSL